MPQVGERRVGRTETVEWDGARWTPVPHQASGAEGGYHPGLADSEHPGLAALKGFISGGATGLPTAARIAQFGLIPLLTGGMSIPAQMAIGAGSQGMADLADRAADDPNAPQDFGSFMTRAATGAIGPAVVGGGMKLLSKVPGAALAVASRMPGKIGLAAKAATALRAGMPEAEGAAAAGYTPSRPKTISYSNRPGAASGDIPTASGWQEPHAVDTDLVSTLDRYMPNTSRATAAETSSVGAGRVPYARPQAVEPPALEGLDRYMPNSGAPAAAESTSIGAGRTPFARPQVRPSAEDVAKASQYGIPDSLASLDGDAITAAPKPMTVLEQLRAGIDPTKISTTAPVATEADYAARAASMAPRSAPASAAATRAVATAPAPIPAPVPTPRINASLAALEPAEQGIADVGLFRSGAGLPGQMTPSELKGIEDFGQGVYDAELGMVLPKTPAFDYEGAANYYNDIPAPGPGVDLMYGNAEVPEGVVSNLDDLLKIRRGGAPALEPLPNPADVPAALETLPATTRTPVSMQALGDDDGYTAFSKMVDDMAANTSDEQFAREVGTGKSKRWSQKDYKRMGYTTPSRYPEISR